MCEYDSDAVWLESLNTGDMDFYQQPTPATMQDRRTGGRKAKGRRGGPGGYFRPFQMGPSGAMAGPLAVAAGWGVGKGASWKTGSTGWPFICR